MAGSFDDESVIVTGSTQGVGLASDESGWMTGAIVDFDRKVLGTSDNNPIGR